MVKFKTGRGIQMVHSQYGDAIIEKIFSVKGIKWVQARVGDNLVVQTPKSEWKLKDFSK